MTATRAESSRIETWAREQERLAIRAYAIEQGVKGGPPEVVAARIAAYIDARSIAAREQHQRVEAEAKARREARR